MEAKIFWGDIGSVQNSLNKLLKTVASIVSVTQSTTGTMSSTMYLTVIYIPKTGLSEDEPKSELTDVDYIPLDR